MNITINLEQAIALVQDGTQVKFKITNRIASSENIAKELFVFAAAAQLYQHPATVLDLNVYPDSRAEALTRNLPYYRAVEMEQTYDTLLDAQNAQLVIRSRLNRTVTSIAQSLNSAYPVVNTYDLSSSGTPQTIPISAVDVAPHALGGTDAHTPVTLDKLNTELIGALLDAAGTPRPSTTIEIPFTAPLNASYDSITEIPADARIVSTTLQITTPLNNNATLSVQVLEPAPVTLMATTENNPALADTYRIEDEVATAANGKVRLVVGNAPTEGAGILTVEYVQTTLR